MKDELAKIRRLIAGVREFAPLRLAGADLADVNEALGIIEHECDMLESLETMDTAFFEHIEAVSPAMATLARILRAHGIDPQTLMN